VAASPAKLIIYPAFIENQLNAPKHLAARMRELVDRAAQTFGVRRHA
jgi:hypothetical protein